MNQQITGEIYMQKKAIIAMSGGVDSSVAAYLMVKDGYDCAGATLKLYDNPQCSFPLSWSRRLAK